MKKKKEEDGGMRVLVFTMYEVYAAVAVYWCNGHATAAP